MSTVFEAYQNQNYDELKQKCLSNGKLFEDPLFQASEKSLFTFKRSSQVIRWKRPFELVSNPELFVNGINQNDVDQGRIGDCWFIAAVCAVATQPSYIDRVIPKDQSFAKDSYCGLFHFRFWRYGQWLDVCVDDRLPVDSNNQLIYCSNRKFRNEFWCSLIEKAYAKLHGCYEFLEGGLTQEAIVDMTGGSCETFNLKEILSKNEEQNLWNYLFKASKLGSLCGASITPAANQSIEGTLSNGLVVGHAYAITKIAEIKSSHKQFKYLQSISNNYTHSSTLMHKSSRFLNDRICLIRLRNPWGNEFEWQGAWSDYSSEWYQIDSKLKKELGLVSEFDGEFWMSFSDFLENYSTLNVCHMNMHAFDNIQTDGDEWQMRQFDGKWIRGVNAGGNVYYDTFSTNPQYFVNIKCEEKATLIVSLLNKDMNELRRANYGQYAGLPKQFHLFKVADSLNIESYSKDKTKIPLNNLKLIHFSFEYPQEREFTQRFQIESGSYVIIPSIYDPNVEGNFVLRIFTDGQLKVSDELHSKANFNYRKDIIYTCSSSEDIAPKVNTKLFWMIVLLVSSMIVIFIPWLGFPLILTIINFIHMILMNKDQVRVFFDRFKVMTNLF